MASNATKNPSYQDMVLDALQALETGRKGVSYQAIKGFVVNRYGLESNNTTIGLIKRAIKSALLNDKIWQKTGNGATGSFKIKNVTAKTSSRPEVAVMKASVKPKKASTKTKKTKADKENKTPKRRAAQEPTFALATAAEQF